MSEVWELDLTQPELLVLLVLADHADENGICWPSLATVAARAKCSIDGASRIISRLTEAGLLLKKRRFQKSTVYRIVREAFVKLAPEQNRSEPPSDSTSQSLDSMPGVDLITTLESPRENHQGSTSRKKPPKAMELPDTDLLGKPTKVKPTKRMPEDWQPSEKFREWFRANKLTISFNTELENLRDFEFARPHHDWDAVARRWMREAQRRADESRSRYQAPQARQRPLGVKF